MAAQPSLPAETVTFQRGLEDLIRGDEIAFRHSRAALEDSLRGLPQPIWTALPAVLRAQALDAVSASGDSGGDSRFRCERGMGSCCQGLSGTLILARQASDRGQTSGLPVARASGPVENLICSQHVLRFKESRGATQRGESEPILCRATENRRE